MTAWPQESTLIPAHRISTHVLDLQACNPEGGCFALMDDETSPFVQLVEGDDLGAQRIPSEQLKRAVPVYRGVESEVIDASERLFDELDGDAGPPSFVMRDRVILFLAAFRTYPQGDLHGTRP